MATSTAIQPPAWVSTSGLAHRFGRDLFTSGDQIGGCTYAAEMRLGFDTDKLALDGYFCVQGVPAVAFVREETIAALGFENIYKPLWNQGLVSVLLVLGGETVKAYSTLGLPGTDIGDKQFIQSLDIVTGAVTGFIDGVESGRIFREHRDKFHLDQRVDEVLLGNLNRACGKLANELVDSLQAQALVMQVMFVAYLEDRGILDGRDFREADPEGKASTFLSLLAAEKPRGFMSLFDKLRGEFNGNIFRAPCSFEDAALKVKLTVSHMATLHAFRDGRIDEGKQQYRFWPYDFKYIPVELISAIYERFLDSDHASRRRHGQYYTPLFLADLVIDQLLACHPEHAAGDPGTEVLDPSCGSGIFLVRLFQRRVEHWRSTNGNQQPTWTQLKSMLTRLHGCDLDRGAIRVAAVSLYIALLEQADPPLIRELRRRGRVLPNLVDESLHSGDFFDYAPKKTFDLLIGNPPWVGRGAQQVAWRFLWRGSEHANEGHYALVLPGMDFLVNTNSVAARSRLFDETTVSRVLNLADFRHLLFSGGKEPAAVIVGRFGQSEQDESFEYYFPKADTAVRERGVLLLGPTDRTRIRVTDVVNFLPGQLNRLKLEMWARSPDRRLLSRLRAMPAIGELAVSFDSLRGKSNDAPANLIREGKWILGQGFQPFGEGGLPGKRNTPKPSELVGRYPFLAKSAMTRGWIAHFPRQSFSDSGNAAMVRSRGFEEGFLGPRVLIGRGLSQDGHAVSAAFEDRPLTFQHIVMALRGRVGDEDRLKLACAILNSRLVAWFLLHTTVSMGMERGDLRNDDILNVPFPLPNDFPNTVVADMVARDIVRMVDSWKPQGALVSGIQDTDLKALDQLVYRYFDLSDQERALVDDTADFIIPSIQPRRDDISLLVEQVYEDDYVSYAGMLKARLADWMPGQGMETHIYQTEELALIKISMSNQPSPETRVSRLDLSLQETIEMFHASVAQVEEGATMLKLANVRLFSGQDLYLLKPRLRRYWLRATALADADDIAADLFAARSATLRMESDVRGRH